MVMISEIMLDTKKGECQLIQNKNGLLIPPTLSRHGLTADHSLIKNTLMGFMFSGHV